MNNAYHGLGYQVYAPWYGSRSNITTIIISDGINSIGDWMFEKCENLTRVTIPDTVLRIGTAAFQECKKLARITIPNGVTEIAMETFQDCSRLDNVVIPGSATNIGHRAFQDCGSLSNIKIPDSVLAIGTEAFKGCTNLRSLTIPSQVTGISDELFSGCTNLTRVDIPISVDTIGNNVFTDCIRLTDIYYAGTQQQWENIYVEDSSKEKLASVTIHCNSGGSSSNSYTVTFDANGGEVDTDLISVTTGKTYGTLPVPTRSGFKFNGWYTAEIGGTQIKATTKVNLSDDQTLYAHWTKNPTTKTYTIKLDANSGKVTPSSIKVESGRTYFDDLPTPTRNGWKFAGWYTSKTGTTKIASTTKATANRTIYAHWTRAKTFLVTFNANGGMVDQDRKVVRTANLYGELPTPTKNNSHFQGWYTKKTGGTKVTETTRVNLTADQTLYARWQSSATVRSTQRGTYRVTIPAYYDLALYASSSTAKISSQPEITASQTITCTQRATLSNGTVRYYGKVNGKTGWFTYSCGMSTK